MSGSRRNLLRRAGPLTGPGPPPGAAFAQRALAAYIRISLRPGRSRVVTLTVPQRQLQYRQDARGWVTAPGRRRVYVGGDERAALAATVTIPR